MAFNVCHIGFKVCLVFEVRPLGFPGLPTWFSRFAQLAFKVWPNVWSRLSRFGHMLSEVCKLVLRRWCASSSELRGVGGCRAPKGSRSGNAGVVVSQLTCACPPTRESWDWGHARGARSPPLIHHRRLILQGFLLLYHALCFGFTHQSSPYYCNIGNCILQWIKGCWSSRICWCFSSKAYSGSLGRNARFELRLSDILFSIYARVSIS